MFLHLFKKRETRQPRSAWRSLLLVFIICGVTWAFWQNTQKQVNILNERMSVWDDPVVLSSDERNALRDMIGEFKARYGMEVRMEIISEQLKRPSSEKPIIYLGINQETEEVMVSLPPLLRKALGPEFSAQLEQDYMRPHMQTKDYALAMADALKGIWDSLGKLDNESN